jgi:hypothetical protein
VPDDVHQLDCLYWHAVMQHAAAVVVADVAALAVGFCGGGKETSHGVQFAIKLWREFNAVCFTDEA